MGADQNFDWRMTAASALDWWGEAGVDAMIDEAPRNWLARPAAPVADVAEPEINARGNTARGIVVPAVVATVPLPDNLSAFDAWRLGPDAPEAEWPGIAIGPQGSLASGLMILIDLPEREDADSGVLLSGPAGRLFDRMLDAIGVNRASIYLAAVCTKRPPAGRVSAEIELRLNEIARRHVLLAAPKSLLLMGNAPSRALLEMDALRARGSLRDINPAEGDTPVMADRVRTQAVASFHPRFLLERPAAKAEAWKDLQMLMGNLNS